MATSSADLSDTPEPVMDHEKQLTTAEIWWRDHYEMLERHGYRLRPRYRPGWIPSWLGTGKSFLDFEDSVHSRVDQVLDATRISDGNVVSIKRVGRGSREPELALFLSSEPRHGDSADPLNHCVPILDHFSDESEPDYTFLVMPLLRWFDDPPFFSVDEVLEFIQQTLEGLVYMHKRGVAHRDCSTLNIMLEATSMYPRGFHPVASVLDASFKKLAPYRHRRNSPGIKYYFIDFGISSRFPEDAKDEEKKVTGVNGQDREVPELSDYLPYNPFRVDIFILGNVYRKSFLDRYSNLSFLNDLISSMTSELSRRRPSAAEALDRLQSIVATQPSYRLRWRLKPRDTGFIRNIFYDMDSVAREGIHITKKVMKAPFSLVR